MIWLKRSAQLLLALTGAAAGSGAAHAQEDPPAVISPLRVESEPRSAVADRERSRLNAATVPPPYVYRRR